MVTAKARTAFERLSKRLRWERQQKLLPVRLQRWRWQRHCSLQRQRVLEHCCTVLRKSLEPQLAGSAV